MAQNGSDTKKQEPNAAAGAVVILVFIVLVIWAGSTILSPKQPSQADVAAPTTTESAAETAATETKKSDTPVEYVSALAQASTYANTMHMSKRGVYDQLTSEFGGKFTAEAAQYAIDNVKSDWNANALSSAKTYQNSMHMSPAAIKDQLVSEHGAKFTAAEADFAILHLND